MKNTKSLNCDSGVSMEPITLNKIGSLIALVIMGLLFATVALIIEVFKDTKNCTRSTTLESRIDVQQGINVGPENFDKVNKLMYPYTS